MSDDIFACEVRVSALPDGVDASWLGRLSVDGVWRLVQCAILRARTTLEQRMTLMATGDMVELTENEWLVKALSAQYNAPEEEIA